MFLTNKNQFCVNPIKTSINGTIFTKKKHSISTFNVELYNKFFQNDRNHNMREMHMTIQNLYKHIFQKNTINGNAYASIKIIQSVNPRQ